MQWVESLWYHAMAKKKKSAKSNSSGKKSKRTSKRSSKHRNGCLSRFWLVSVAVLAVLFACIFFANKYKEQVRIERSHREDEKVLLNYQVLGIDLSHHQQVKDWQAVRKANVRFAYLKATEGLSVEDNKYSNYYDGAKKAGLRVGSYHFFIFERDAHKQARFFLTHLRYEKGDLPPVVDVEYESRNRRKPSNNASRRSELQRFSDEVFEALGVYPVFYTNKECFRDIFEGTKMDNELWISHISTEKEPNISSHWVLWQYTHHGYVPGINGDVDKNVFNGTQDAFTQWINSKWN